MITITRSGRVSRPPTSRPSSLEEETMIAHWMASVAGFRGGSLSDLDSEDDATYVPSTIDDVSTVTSSTSAENDQE